MSVFALMFAATLPATAPYQQPSIAIHPGETITLQFRDGAAIVVERGRAGPLSTFETRMLSEVQAQEIPADAGPQPAMSMKSTLGVESPRAPPDRIRLTFRRVPALRPGAADHSFLVLLNGYGNSFRYHAAMHVNGRVVTTDVCEIRSQVPGSEHWPYVIDQLDLTAAWLEPAQQGNVRCE